MESLFVLVVPSLRHGLRQKALVPWMCPLQGKETPRRATAGGSWSGREGRS